MPRSEMRLSAVLGPTNTGKTHLAVERMLAYRSGMIGLPLRLLAREIYDRVAASKGTGAAALVTGEERIVPERARYFVCTTESMPLDLNVEFLAVDEIQLAADAERGHVFTDRLLRARGRQETILMGAATMRPALRELLPDVRPVVRPRFSDLSYAGASRLARLPPRSAVVAFSISDVYEIADILRRQRGGCAVVLGALSPRARNAQVAMYQAGDVEHIVATDAIGMGLNMDVNHVAFAGLRKFDGRRVKTLAAHELAQIAGRAGRHTNDGTFGVTAALNGMEPSLVQAIENHRFDDVGSVMWRNPHLDFRSPLALLKSLEERPLNGFLVRAEEADDHRALASLVRDGDVTRLASHPEAVRLLWEVCRVPDYRKVMHDHHVRLLAHIFRHLAGPQMRLPEDWVHRSITRLNRSGGDIDLLMSRIAHIRTWTYISHRSDWVADHAGLREEARAIEDRLSDALHERLIQRFVDRRMAFVARRLGQGQTLDSHVDDDGHIIVEGESTDCLQGFRLMRPPRKGQALDRVLAGEARRVAAREVGCRVEELVAGGAGCLEVDNALVVRWRGDPVARLASGRSIVEPAFVVIASDILTDSDTRRIRVAIEGWFAGRLATSLKPLLALADGRFTGAARGIAFQLVEGLGVSTERTCLDLVNGLDAIDRRQLTKLGVRFGTRAVFVKPMMSSRDLTLRSILWALAHGQETAPAVPSRGEVALAAEPSLPESFWQAIGYAVLGGRALRVDMAERLAAGMRTLTRRGWSAAPDDLVSLSGSSREAFASIAQDLGFRARIVDGDVLVARFRQRPPRPEPLDPLSPFIGLAGLKIAR